MEETKCRYERALEYFAGIVERGGTAGGQLPSFEDICFCASVDSAGFNRYVYGIFGLSGEEILEVCRSRVPVTML